MWRILKINLKLSNEDKHDVLMIEWYCLAIELAIVQKNLDVAHQHAIDLQEWVHTVEESLIKVRGAVRKRELE